MNAPIQRQVGKQKKVVEVIKNSLSRKEADEIVDRLFESNAPNMTMEEVLAHAAQFQAAKQTA